MNFIVIMIMVLQKRSTITLVAGQSVYNLPSDFGRIINRTLWDI